MTVLEWPVKTPHLMGIVNVTPDSFSDGGRYTQIDTALAHIEQLEKDGAHSIDLGAESTRPGAIPVDSDTEITRLKEVLNNCNTTLPISIDTQKATVAEWALNHGASLINDVSGLRDPNMASVIAQANCPIVIMHMQGEPKTMQNRPNYHNILEEITLFFQEKIDYASQLGIQKIILDPGIGFGKTLEHNLEILANIHTFHSLGYPIMIGTSNKSFIGTLCNTNPQDRLAGTLSSCLTALQNNVQLFRVHDVKNHHHAFTIWNQIKSKVQ